MAKTNELLESGSVIGNVKDEKAMAESCVIEVTPAGEFITYGVGVPLMQMRFPDKARGRVAVASM